MTKEKFSEQETAFIDKARDLHTMMMAEPQHARVYVPEIRALLQQAEAEAWVLEPHRFCGSETINMELDNYEEMSKRHHCIEEAKLAYRQLLNGSREPVQTVLRIRNLLSQAHVNAGILDPTESRTPTDMEKELDLIVTSVRQSKPRSP